MESNSQLAWIGDVIEGYLQDTSFLPESILSFLGPHLLRRTMTPHRIAEIYRLLSHAIVYISHIFNCDKSLE